MFKTVIKEAGIIILLLITIALILGIVFYDYNPTNKTVPKKMEAYVLPDDIKEELTESLEEGQNIVKTYYVDSTDLNAYESSKNYNKGKANPFSDYTIDTTKNEVSGNNVNNAVGGNNTNNNTNTSESYLNNKIVK